jgi:repressor LexA|nr:MAG TPA: Repressor protein CI [Caudoviricetes sp.]
MKKDSDMLLRLRMLMKETGLNQTQFAEKINMRQNNLSEILSGKRSIGPNVINKLVISFGININWFITGEGEIYKKRTWADDMSDGLSETQVSIRKEETRPRIPYTAAAGSLTSAVEGVTSEQCEHIPRISFFPEYDFTIIIKGDSMEPKYEGGDEVACKRIDNTSFIQWGKPHVLDTAQGILIKRTYEDGDKIRCVSYNPEYPDFSIDKDEIYSMSLVVGLVRL